MNNFAVIRYQINARRVRLESIARILGREHVTNPQLDWDLFKAELSNEEADLEALWRYNERKSN